MARKADNSGLIVVVIAVIALAGLVAVVLPMLTSSSAGSTPEGSSTPSTGTRTGWDVLADIGEAIFAGDKT